MEIKKYEAVVKPVEGVLNIRSQFSMHECFLT